ncbi:Threonine--tRNA ligase [Gossypium arboreum]|uniref:Threonine--tRNA ligase n=1 Tax=Gossypium arboreum TaxID=29729 RepID=A0A0B0NME9_GOSAR|nr:Threonine--tRNA ligase [Gossypium arboreum]
MFATIGYGINLSNEVIDQLLVHLESKTNNYLEWLQSKIQNDHKTFCPKAPLVLDQMLVRMDEIVCDMYVSDAFNTVRNHIWNQGHHCQVMRRGCLHQLNLSLISYHQMTMRN